MKRFFIPDVSEEQKKRLQKKQISFSDASAIGKSGIIVYSEFTSAVLKSLRRFPIKEQMLSENDGIYCLTTKTGTWNNSTWFTKVTPVELSEAFGKKLTIDHWGNNWRKAYLSTMESVLLPSLNSPIMIHDEIGVAPPIDDSNFHVFACASPTGELRRAKIPKKVWGLEVYPSTRSRRKAFKFSGTGSRIRDDSGFVVAEIIGRNLYILLDIFYYETVSQHEILRRILSEALENFKILDRKSQEACYIPSVSPGLNVNEYNRRYVEFRDIAAEILLPRIKTDVVVHRSESGTADPIFDARIHIHFDSSSCGKEIRNPCRIFDYEVCGCTNVYEPGNGLVIQDSNSRAVAELINGNNLYILHPLFKSSCYWENDLSPILFRKILELAVAEMKLTPSGRRYREKRQKVLSLKNYLRLCENRVANGKKLLEMELPVIQLGIRSLQMKIASNRIKDIAPMENTKLATLPKVKQVLVASSNRMHVFTETIICKDMKSATKHELGEYRIDINLLGNEGCVRFFNLTRKVDGKQSPYVLASGETFKANLQEIMPDMLSKGAIEALIMVCIGFLETVSPNDADALAILQQYPVVAA